MDLVDRLKYIIDIKGLTSYKISIDTGINESVLSRLLNKKTKKPHGNTIKLLANYLHVSENWLLTGEGEMQNTSKNKNEAIQVDLNVIYVPIVSQYAYAGYSGNFDDSGYMESLPTQPVYIDREVKGHYVMFEVKGDSMDNDSKDSLQEGDLLLSREVRKEYWKYKLHLKWNFVIVHKTEGVIVKKITEHDVEKGIITIHSLNPMYEDRELSLNDIAQLFNVVQIQRKV